MTYPAAQTSSLRALYLDESATFKTQSLRLKDMAAVIIFKGQTWLPRLTTFTQSPPLEPRQATMPALPPQTQITCC